MFLPLGRYHLEMVIAPKELKWQDYMDLWKYVWLFAKLKLHEQLFWRKIHWITTDSIEFLKKKKKTLYFTSVSRNHLQNDILTNYHMFGWCIIMHPRQITTSDSKYKALLKKKIYKRKSKVHLMQMNKINCRFNYCLRSGALNHWICWGATWTLVIGAVYLSWKILTDQSLLTSLPASSSLDTFSPFQSTNISICIISTSQ